MKHRKAPFLLIQILFLLSAALIAGAQSSTNVSGTWKMNAEKSKFERGGPSAITIKFDQQEKTLNETLTLTNERGEQTHNFTYTLDGKESAQQLEGMNIKTTARWEGESLHLEFKNNEGFSFLRKISLSADKKSMTMDVKQTNPGGSVNDVVILDRQ
ncbi:MAG TPA: hypothetical protein VIG62_24440 [Blastocatellia bacterium]|jgi:hypothetical protein